MRKIGTEERRARLGVRHHLARPAGSAQEISSDLVGLHSSDPATVFLSSWARVRGFTAPDLEEALYEERSLIRMLGMRGTLFVVPIEIAAVMDEACTKSLAPRQRSRLVKMLEEQSVADDGEAWLARVEQLTLDALEAAGEATATELAKLVPELQTRLTFGAGKTWAAEVGVSTRVLFLLATRGLVVRTRPLGTWISGQYRWAQVEHWLGRPLPSVDHAEASSELLGRWLRTFGPATLTDIRWWTGWTARKAKATLAAIDAEEVALEESTGFVLADEVKRTRTPRPWVRLLPGLDPTVMGWKERDWYLGVHARELFDRNGNAGPTIWANGCAVGAWGQAEDGEVTVELLEPVSRDVERLLEIERARLREWLGEVRIRPRFRTGLERRLSG